MYKSNQYNSKLSTKRNCCYKGNKNNAELKVNHHQGNFKGNQHNAGCCQIKANQPTYRGN